jgi:hypothetical protein
MITFGDVQDAFLFVNSAGYGMHSAVLCKDTGQIFYRSEMGDVDEVDDEDLDWDKCIQIPHKNDLDLGQSLVFEFVEVHLPDDYDRVGQMFRRAGAYGRFKDLLDSKGLLEIWNDFESQREEQVLRQWCTENEIDLSG